jgi:predicted MFS family arabinose efflux permease
VLFVRCEARVANPLMPLSLFRNRVFTSANVMTLFLYGALSGVLFLLPFDLIERRGLSATEVGLTLLPIGIIIGTLSRVAGAWADRNGPRGPLAIGSVLVAMGAAGLAFGVTDFWIGVMAPVVLMSVGIALVVAPLTTAVMVAAPDTQSGAASGVNNAASRLAGLFAVAIIGALASAVFFNEIGVGNTAVADLRFGILPDAGHTDRALLERAFIQAYGAAMWIAASWGLLAALIALLFLRPAEPEMARAAS